MIYFQVRLSSSDTTLLQKLFEDKSFRIFQIKEGGYSYGSIAKSAFPEMMKIVADKQDSHLEMLDQHEFEAVQATLFTKTT